MGKQSQTTTRVYGNTTTSNPYATASTNNSGTTSAFAPGSALETIYNTVNKNMDSLLNDYLNPNLNSTTNQAKFNSFVNTLNNTTAANLENNIINPLSNRNMVRSSQATDLYKNLATSNTNATADFVNDLLSSSYVFTYAKVKNNDVPLFTKFNKRFKISPFEYFTKKEYEYSDNHFIWKNYSPKT